MAVLAIMGLNSLVFAQNVSEKSNEVYYGDVRGFIYNEQTGDRIVGASVVVLEAKRAAYSDQDGYYAVTNVKTGDVHLMCFAAGYDTIFINHLTVFPGSNLKKDFYLSPSLKEENIGKIEQIDIVAKSKNKNPQIAVQSVDAKTIYKMPAVGADPDIIQYLQILPGVVFSGDQGGQLYIRGGSPVMNKVMLDGMTIYNPFHSIGLFSVFETDLIQNADVYSAGFGAEYGGRISAVVDIKTRDGNRKKFSGKVGMSTFSTKVLLEMPLKKFKAGEDNSTLVVSYKNSFLKQSSRLFYNYANPSKLPYTFGDLFVKYSANFSSGGYAKLYAFNFNDNVDFPSSTSYAWNSYGFGGKFLVVPEQSKTKVDGFFLYSNYEIQQRETDGKPRSSSIGGFNMGMNFTYNFKKDELKFGTEINGFRTIFQIYNSNDRFISQDESTTEINGFANYKFVRKRLVANLGLRGQYYASLSNQSLEPRIQVRYNPFGGFGIKFAAGKYSQNLLSAISDKDVVNLFYGFLSGPDNLPKSFNGQDLTHKLQTANHYVFGFDYVLKKHSTFNFEMFLKDFTQITNINRDKLFDDDEYNQDKPASLREDFVVETGKAYGGDLSYKYSHKGWYVWAVYSLTWVNRFNGNFTYQPTFDRRHNANAMVSYEFDKKNPTEVSLRWNFGSGFPFTQTQGYYEKNTFTGGIGTDYTSGNGTLGIVYAGLNQGRLPYYHRLDFSLKRTWKLKNKRDFNLIFSITNLYNRSNIFYFDRIKYVRVDQLPILPAVGVNYSF